MANGCNIPDFCVERSTDNNGDLCPGVCPPNCQTGEVIETNVATDNRGCTVVAYTCVPGIIMTRKVKIFVISNINLQQGDNNKEKK